MSFSGDIQYREIDPDDWSEFLNFLNQKDSPNQTKKQRPAGTVFESTVGDCAQLGNKKLHYRKLSRLEARAAARRTKTAKSANASGKGYRRE